MLQCTAQLVDDVLLLLGFFLHQNSRLCRGGSEHLLHPTLNVGLYVDSQSGLSSEDPGLFLVERFLKSTVYVVRHDSALLSLNSLKAGGKLCHFHVCYMCSVQQSLLDCRPYLMHPGLQEQFSSQHT